MSLTEIEKRFYEAFDIEPKKDKVYCCRIFMGNCVLSDSPCKRKNKLNCPKYKGEGQTYTYPPITDHVLLKLICIYSSWGEFYEMTSVDDLKEQILEGLVYVKTNADDYEYITEEHIDELYRGVRKIMGVE